MKKLLVFSAALLFALSTFVSGASAQDGKCKQLYKKGTDGIKKDKQCKDDAMNVFKKLGAQIRTCKAHRNNMKACRRAKRAAKKICRKKKKVCKNVCKDTKKACLKSCKGKKGKAKRKCKKACRKAKRKCKKVCRVDHRPCKKAAKAAKRACVKAAKSTAAFAVCKDARKLTRKATGRLFKCAWKHYSKAVACTGTSLLQSLKKD